MERWATFDCYGTLIDWDGGIRAELARVFGDDQADDAARALPRGRAGDPARRDAQLPPGDDGHDAPARSARGEAHGLAEALPGWRAFPEVHRALEEARRRGWKLGVLSNTDDDYIAASQVQIGITFDEVIVAQEIGSYKPAPRHWEEFFARTQRRAKDRYVHVAASLFHDIAPANALGVPSVWVNRLGETAPDDAQPTRELTDLFALPETLDELVPA